MGRCDARVRRPAAVDPTELIAAAEALRNGGPVAPPVASADEVEELALALESGVEPAVDAQAIDVEDVADVDAAIDIEDVVEIDAAIEDEGVVDVDAVIEGEDVVDVGAVIDVEDAVGIEAPIAAEAPIAVEAPAADADTVDIGGQPISRPLYMIFLSEADELIQVLSRDIADWRGQPTRGAGEAAMRAVHSLAGSAAVVGLGGVHDIAERIDRFYQAQRACGDVPEPHELESLAYVIERLHAMLHQFAAGSAPRPEPDAFDAVSALVAAWVGRKQRVKPAADDAVAIEEPADEADTLVFAIDGGADGVGEGFPNADAEVEVLDGASADVVLDEPAIAPPRDEFDRGAAAGLRRGGGRLPAADRRQPASLARRSGGRFAAADADAPPAHGQGQRADGRRDGRSASWCTRSRRGSRRLAALAVVPTASDRRADLRSYDGAVRCSRRSADPSLAAARHGRRAPRCLRAPRRRARRSADAAPPAAEAATAAAAATAASAAAAARPMPLPPRRRRTRHSPWCACAPTCSTDWSTRRARCRSRVRDSTTR